MCPIPRLPLLQESCFYHSWSPLESINTGGLLQDRSTCKWTADCGLFFSTGDGGQMLGLHSSVKGAQTEPGNMQATAFSHRLAQQHGNMREPQLMRKRGVVKCGARLNSHSFFPFPAFSPTLHDVRSVWRRSKGLLWWNSDFREVVLVCIYVSSRQSHNRIGHIWNTHIVWKLLGTILIKVAQPPSKNKKKSFGKCGSVGQRDGPHHHRNQDGGILQYLLPSFPSRHSIQFLQLRYSSFKYQYEHFYKINGLCFIYVTK